MKPARFDYARPESLVDTLQLLARHGGEATVLAGGQSLVPMLNLRVAQPALLVDINGIPNLASIARVGNVLVIGSRARHNDILRSALVRHAAPLLTQALPHIAHEAIRNRGTLGGSLALADPAAELPACAICLEADIVAASVRGERRIVAEGFCKGLFATDLAPDELIVRIEIPVRDERWRFGFDEVARRPGDFAIAGLAVALRTNAGNVTDARIVVFGVESAPSRARSAEAALIGRTLADAQVRATACVSLQADLHAARSEDYPAAYRLHLAAVLLARLLAGLSEGQHGRS